MYSIKTVGFPIYLAAGLTAGLVAVDARAASEDFCRQYTSDAVADQKRNLEMGCGFTGAPWNQDPGHHPWCVESREDSANKQRDDRRYWLDRCQRCNGFADRAMAAIDKAAKRCGFGGGRWEPNRAGHFRWCMESKEEHVNREDEFRTYDADKCIRCSDYAGAAVKAQEENKTRGCGFTGPEWGTDPKGHFDWCWSLQRSHQGEPAGKTAQRAAVLRNNCPDARKRTECQKYADRAVSQYDAMKKLANCSQSGVKWHGNRQNHYMWCVAVSDAESSAHDRERQATLDACPASGPAPVKEQCLVSATIRNKTCISTDGSPMPSRPPGSLSNIGCGDTKDKAVERAKAIMNSEQCLSEGDTPDKGCCTYDYVVSQGCLCSGTGTLGRRPVLVHPRSRVLQKEAPSPLKKVQPQR